MNDKRMKKYRVGRLLCGSMRRALRRLQESGANINFEEQQTEYWFEKYFIVSGSDIDLVDAVLQQLTNIE